MVQSHPSTPAERVQWATYMLAHPGEYGLITQLSRRLNVSRPTLYAWKATAQQALEHAFRAMLLRVDGWAAPVFAHAAGEIIPRNAARKARADYNNDFVFDVDALIRIEVL